VYLSPSQLKLKNFANARGQLCEGGSISAPFLCVFHIRPYSPSVNNNPALTPERPETLFRKALSRQSNLPRELIMLPEEKEYARQVRKVRLNGDVMHPRSRLCCPIVLVHARPEHQRAGKQQRAEVGRRTVVRVDVEDVLERRPLLVPRYRFGLCTQVVRRAARSVESVPLNHVRTVVVPVAPAERDVCELGEDFSYSAGGLRIPRAVRDEDGLLSRVAEPRVTR
jgi:hypothetical protein